MDTLFHDINTLVKINKLLNSCKILGLFPENSKVANARFQAAGALRDAAIREWGFLSADDRRNLIRYQLLVVYIINPINNMFNIGSYWEALCIFYVYSI